MANTKISALPVASTLDGAEVIPVVKSGVNSKVPLSRITEAIPNGTYVPTADLVAEAAARVAADATKAADSVVVKLTGDQSVTSGRKDFLGGITVRGPRAINLRSYGVSPGGSINTALVSLLADAASTGAEAVIDPSGTSEYIWSLTTSIVLPKTPGFRMSGVDKYGSLIKATAITAGQPMVKWDDTVDGHVEDQTIENMAFSRSNTDGPVLQFAQHNSPADPRLGDRWKSRIVNVQMQGFSAGTAIICDIPYLLHGEIRRLWLKGSTGAEGIGLRLYNGSHGLIEKLYTPVKSTAPRTLLKIDTGGSHTVIAPRAEGGGNGGYCYHLVNVSGSTLIDPQSEGAGEDAIFLIDSCFGIELVNPGVGYPDTTASASPRGIKFVNSNGCRVSRGQVGDWSGLTGGKIVEFDANSNENSVEDMVVTAGLNPIAQVTDSGLNNRVRLLVAGTNSPTHQRQERGYPTKRGFKKSGKWYTAGPMSTMTTGLLTSGRLYYLPIDIDVWTTVDRLGCGITVVGSSGSVIRFGLYAGDGTNWPGDLIAATEGTAAGTSAVPVSFIFGTAQKLSPGRYWAAIVGQGAPVTAPTVRVHGTVADPTVGLFGQSDAYGMALYQDSVTGALPTTAAPTADITPAPLVQYRAA